MTNAELAVLSLVVEAPRHGYEIEQAIAERGMREWTEIGFSSIYYHSRYSSFLLVECPMMYFERG